MSPLLIRLDRELQLTTDPTRRAELVARKGAYLARIGHFDAARELVAELRRDFGDGHSGRITAWIMLTEGLLYQFEELSPKALDRVTRAQVLGVAMKDSSIIAIASAWKAQLEFEASQFDAMIKSLQSARAHARDDDHGAIARLALVMTDALLLCGDKRSAQVWFLKSREHALIEGDQATIDALLFNRAAIGFARLRADQCLDELDRDELFTVRSEIASEGNLQKLVGVNAFANHLALCQARLLILDEKYLDAIDALQIVRATRPFADYHFNQTFIDLEITYCLHKLGRLDQSRTVFGSVEWTAFDKLDIDEQLVAAWMRHVICAADPLCGDPAQAALHFEAIAAGYRQFCSGLLDSLREFRIGESSGAAASARP